MRPLLWKELRENAKWAAILFVGVSVSFVVWALEELRGGRIDESLASGDVLGILLFPTTIGATALGVLQIVPELKRDAWAFLVHRPVSTTRIFLAKTIAGTGLYLAAVLVPFLVLALVVAAGAPERRVFHPSMLWPGAAIVLAGAGFHGAGMIVALRRARLGTRLLPVWSPAGSLAVTFFWIVDVNELPSAPLFLFIVGTYAVTAIAAWGSFVTCGEARGQPAAARAALGLSLGVAALALFGLLLALGVSAASELRPPRSFLDRRGAVDEARVRHPDTPAFHHFGGRGRGRERIAIGLFGARGIAAQWIHSTFDRVLLGYREKFDNQGGRSYRLVRILGPDGFREPTAAPARGFGRLIDRRWRDYNDFDRGEGKERRHREVLACEEGIYDIDFAGEEVRLVLGAPDGEPFRGVSLERVEGDAEVAVVTDRRVLFYSTREEVLGTVADEITGERGDIRTYLPDREIARVEIPNPIRACPRLSVGRAAGRDAYVFVGERENPMFSAALLVEADASGKVLRQENVFREHEDAGLARASVSAAAAFTPPALAAAAALADEALGTQLLRALVSERPGWLLGLAAILALQSLACAAAARMTARRGGFSRGERRLWVALAALFGPAGLVALAGTRDWAPAAPCAACGRPRSVSLDRCPCCGACLELPPRDGTEIIETGPRERIGSEVRSIP